MDLPPLPENEKHNHEKDDSEKQEGRSTQVLVVVEVVEDDDVQPHMPHELQRRQLWQETPKLDLLAAQRQRSAQSSEDRDGNEAN